jgi:predicted lipid-binding transport protein (Tim44 family)
MTPRPSAAFAAVAVAALAAGCQPQSSTRGDSAGKFRGDQRLVAQTVEDLQSAAGDGDGAKICRDLLSRALAGRLAQGGRGCAASVEAAVKDADSVDLTVESVRVSGERATARVRLETGARDRRTTLQLVRENRRWRIASL